MVCGDVRRVGRVSLCQINSIVMDLQKEGCASQDETMMACEFSSCARDLYAL